jgi:hypothetical protein
MDLSEVDHSFALCLLTNAFNLLQDAIAEQDAKMLFKASKNLGIHY